MGLLFKSLLLITACTAVANSAENKPNVLFIAVDDLRVELNCYGNTIAQTPNIDALASNGMLFERAYCQQAVCNPSRASLLTGLMPDTLKVWDLATHFRQHHADIVTLPQAFKQDGYHARCIGKIFHNWQQNDYRGDAVSWSVPERLHYNTHYADTPMVEGKIPRDHQTIVYKSRAQTECRDVPDEAYFDGRVAKEAIEALKELKAKPFFLAVGFWKPHLPFNAPKKYWDLYDRADVVSPRNPTPPTNAPKIALTDYKIDPRKELSDAEVIELHHGHLAAISYLDAQLGKVLDELKRLELDSNTIVVFWSDHGLHLGEHGLWGKTTNFELDAHVPLIIKTPFYESGRSNSLVELIDLFPTLLELCDIEPPHRLEGVSLKKVLVDPATIVRQAARTQHPRPPYPKKKAPISTMGYSIRTDKVRYTEWLTVPGRRLVARELYDHQNDPGETENHANDPRQAELIERLHEQCWKEFGLD